MGDSNTTDEERNPYNPIHALIFILVNVIVFYIAHLLGHF